MQPKTSFWRKSFTMPIMGLIALYSAAYVIIPLNGGIFWDDWTLVGVNRQAIISDFTDYGIPQQGYFLAAITSLPHAALIGHVLIFMFFLGTTLLLYAILKTVPTVRDDRWYITALFAVWPVNFARISLATLPYAVCLLLFFFSWWIVHARGKKKLWRILGLFLFFASFALNSLLVFYLLFLIYRIWQEVHTGKKLTASIVGNVDFIALPGLYWTFQNVIFPPRGSYASYNSVTVNNLLQLPLKIVESFRMSVVEPIIRAATDAPAIIFVIAFLGGIIVWKYFRSTTNQSIWAQIIMIIAGSAAVIVGISPYLLAGHMPTYFEWASRHLLLVPLGASLLFVGLVNIFFQLVRFPQGRNAFLGLSLVLFTTLNSSVYFSFIQDWLKQESIITNFKAQPAIENNRTFIVRDTTESQNAIQRRYRYYEYTGMFRRAFGSSARLGVPEAEFTGIDSFLSARDSDRYNITEYVADRTVRRIIISPGDISFNLQNTIRLVYGHLVHSAYYRSNISRLTTITIE